VEITIDDNLTIEAIQKEFSGAYPFLKIEFVSPSLKKTKAIAGSELFLPQRKLVTVRDKHTSGKISIDPERHVREVLDELEQTFGLSAKIFRKFGNMWIEAGLTDHWTLALQNSEGQEISETFTKK